MDLDTLKSSWEKKVLIANNTAGLSSAINYLQEEVDSFDKVIRHRDYRETLMCLFLLPFWVYGLYNSVNLIQVSANVILIFTCLLIPFTLWKAKQIETQKNVSIKELLDIEKAKLTKQIQLLKSVAWWYLSPFLIGMTLKLIGNIYTFIDMLESRINMAIVFVFIIGVFLFLCKRIYDVNQTEVKNSLQPLLEMVEKRLSDLK